MGPRLPRAWRTANASLRRRVVCDQREIAAVRLFAMGRRADARDKSRVIESGSKLRQAAAPQRFFSWDERQDFLVACRDRPGPDPGALMTRASFGLSEPLTWRGAACRKSAFDLGVYAMLLQDVRPRTIVELGAGAGGSAAFFSDLARSFSLEAHVVSIDKVAIAEGMPGVSFCHADCVEWLENAVLRRGLYARPMLLVEDFDADISRQMERIDALLVAGDYLVVQDAAGKQDQLEAALRRRPYAVDARYTDFFGVNCTAAPNAILKKLAVD